MFPKLSKTLRTAARQQFWDKNERLCEGQNEKTTGGREKGKEDEQWRERREREDGERREGEEQAAASALRRGLK